MKSTILRSTIIIFLLLLFSSPTSPAQERRIALVIGNSAYKAVPLGNSVNDAIDMTEALKKLGFSVTLKTDANQRIINRAIRSFGKNLKKGDVGLFYYAGHGIQVNGRNYLIPIGAVIETESDVKYEAVDAGRVLGKMEDAGNNMNIIILDACRDNPFARSFRSAERGLAKMDAPTGSILAYATAPGSVASDGPGRNGLYTSALLRLMATPGLKIEDVFKQVRIEVAKASGKKQIPWEASSLMGDFYFTLERGIQIVESPNLIKQDSHGRLDASITYQQWRGMAAGSPVTVNGKTQYIARDLAALEAVLQIQNLSSDNVQLPLSFSLVGKEHETISRFKVFLDPKMKDTLETEITILPDKNKKIYLRSGFEGFDDLANEKLLAIEHSKYNWHWQADNLPLQDTLYKEAIFSGSYRSLKARIVKQKWKGLASGTEVATSSGKATILRNMAAVELSIEIKNLSPVKLPLFPPLYLAGVDGRKFAKVIADKELFSLFPNGQIEISPKQSLEIKLQSKMKDYKKINQAGTLYLVSPTYGWNLEIIYLPKQNDLFK